MKKYAIFLGLFAAVFTAQAAITVGTTPVSLVNSTTVVSANTDKGLFEFALTADAAETLSSVTILVNSTTASSSDFAAASVYQDDGDGLFETEEDMIAGTTATVNIGANTVISTASNNTLTGTKFFVALKTSSTWSVADSATVTLINNGVITSANSPTTTAVTTATISGPDITGPVLLTAVANNKVGGTNAKEAGDQVVLTFGEATNKPIIDITNITSVLVLNNSHSWLDGASAFGTAAWNSTGTVLTINLSGATSIPTVSINDTVTISGSVIKDAASNNASGTTTITGCFGICKHNDDDEDEDIDDDDHFGKVCQNSIINGKLYKIEGSETVYLASSCSLKPFRGDAVFHARGHKFHNIITLSSSAGIEIMTKPALPAGGTLIKGSNKTVWFVTEDGSIKGFVSEKAFKRLGFDFGSIKQISDSDIAEMTMSINIGETDEHPEGAVLKCTTSQTVYMMKGNKKLAFTNPQPYLERGHTWDAIAIVDCNTFPYPQGTTIAQ